MVAGSTDDVPVFLRDHDDILLYHYSVHYQPALDLLRSLNCRRMLKYHNITPPEFLIEYDLATANALRAGRDSLAEHVAVGLARAIGDSAENLSELRAAGAPEAACAVVPPFHRIPELLAGPADPDWTRQLLCADQAGAVAANQPPVQNILMVGRLVPNKGLEHLLRGFACLRAWRRMLRTSGTSSPDCRLIIAGALDPRFREYYRRLYSIIVAGDIARAVWITGSVPQTVLRALYRQAQLFAITSEHEGFCVPLVEAMAHGLSIAALARGAVPETLGDAGLLLEETEPAYLAVAFEKLLSGAGAVGESGESGRRRYATHFTNERIAALLLQTLTDHDTSRPA
jgi:glycosyltransferase involved in cell wall biosynthesis